MKKGIIIALALAALFFLSPALASAQSNYYYVPSNQYNQHSYTGGVYGSTMNEEQLIKFLQQLIIDLQKQLAARDNYYTPGYQNPYYGGGYGYNYGYKDNYVIGDPRGDYRNRDDDEPEVETERARDIEEDEAELRGFVDMNDFDDGEVFFVYGEDEDQIEDVDRDYDSYRDVDEDGDDLQKVRVDSSFDDDDDFEETVFGLDDDTDYYFQICVGYEDEDDDDVIECGGVEEFTTDRD